MASAAQNDEDSITGINITPLVDITLVLLIIFMVTAKMMVSQGVPMDLPRAASASEVQVVFTVAIDREGHVKVDGVEAKDDAALRAAATTAFAKHKELRTVVSASQAVPHGTVLHVVDELRKIGITKIAFGAEKKA
ncbi:MAG: biopolymer transporter ExbD [Myxococcales bacterium]|nr:biopolymer transporter ExbD [Myxococcales bacterium]